MSILTAKIGIILLDEMIKNIDKITKLEYSITGYGLRAKQCGKLSTSRLPILFIKKFKKNIDFFQIKIYNRIMNIRPDKSKSKSISNIRGSLTSMGFFSCPVGNPKTPPFRRPDVKSRK